MRPSHSLPAALLGRAGPLAAALALLAAGCAKKSAHDDHDHSHGGHSHDHGHAHGKSSSSPAASAAPAPSFKAGVGLTLPPETQRALDLATAEVVERPMPQALSVTARILQTSPTLLASATVEVAQADRLAGQTLDGARLVRIDRTGAHATRQAELILALETAPVSKSPLRAGDFIPLTLSITAPASAPVPSIPRSAVLRTTAGTFAYVVNGGAFLRTPITAGVVAGDHVEVSDGLYAGDVVVVRPVEQLWLAELRFTKGGGHSH
ncbi:MAG: hypothetical protein V4773_04110 [Verrucomicrobiota bacterium]